LYNKGIYSIVALHPSVEYLQGKMMESNIFSKIRFLLKPGEGSKNMQIINKLNGQEYLNAV